VAKPARELTALAISALGSLRTAAGTLAHVDESLTFGNPTFRVNRRTFAVVDRYQGSDCLWLRVAAADRERLLMSRLVPVPLRPSSDRALLRTGSVRLASFETAVAREL
jgi:hypothetical protein